MLHSIQYLFFTFDILCQLVDGANILAINTLPSPSHHIFNDVYLLELAKKGHNVTLLGHDEDKHGHPNYTHIVMEEVYKEMKEDLDLIKCKEMSDWETIKSFMWAYREITCILDLQSEGLRKIMEYPQDFFDLIIWDINTGQCLFPLIEKFNRPPIIATNPFLHQPNFFKNVWQSYIPFMTHTFTSHTTFWQKLKSTFSKILLELSRVTHDIPRQIELAESYFGKMNYTVSEIERNVTLMLINYNPVLNYVEALPPNIIPVGGLHIQPKPLSQDFQNILDGAKNGAILFSLGSNVQSRDLGFDRIQAIINTFSRLKQTIIWKFEGDDLEGISKNVHIRKWVPQNDILGHRNTVLFVTHAGLLSSHEIAYNGVPVIGIPFFMDQLQNIGNLVAKGIGEKLDFDDITEENLYNMIQKLLNNKSYRENAKRLASLYKYQMISPLEAAVYWTEYVLKFKTTKHLDLATRDMNFLELTNVDILFVFFTALLFFVVILIYILCIVLKCFCKLLSKPTKTKTL